MDGVATSGGISVGCQGYGLGDLHPGMPLTTGLPSTVSSAQVDKILPAMARVQAGMINPRPNATGYISDGRGKTKTYRYCTLDVILDLARGALSDAGIVSSDNLLMREKNGVLATIFRHAESGQYVAAEFPVPAGLTHIDLKSIITYARRVNRECLLDITAEWDRDAGEGLPDEENPERQKTVAVSPQQGKPWLLGRLWEAMEHTSKNALLLLRVWRAHRDSLAEMARERSTRDEYTQLASAVAEFLKSAYGEPFALAWAGALTLTTQEAIDTFRVTYDQEYKGPVNAMRRYAADAVSYLTEHLIAETKRAEARIALATALDAEVGEVEHQAVAEQEAAKPIPPAGFALVDHVGEAVTDLITDRHHFAIDYADVWCQLTHAARVVLQENNQAALDWVAEDPSAAEDLEAALAEVSLAESDVTAEFERIRNTLDAPENRDDGSITDAPSKFGDTGNVGGIPESSPTRQVDDFDFAPLRTRQPVTVPTGRGGNPNLAAYLDALENDLASVCDQPMMRAWLVANEPVYMATGFSMGTRARAMGMAMRRRIMLGMPASAEDEA